MLPHGGLRGTPLGLAARSMSSPPNSYSTGSRGTATATVLYVLHLPKTRRHHGVGQARAGGQSPGQGGTHQT